MPTLNWIGKDKVINHHLDVPFRILEHQYGFNEQGMQEKPVNSGNMIIHGDNLEALKALLPQYEGKVKCIYIDPPYNTGNEGWAYNDNVNDPKIRKWLHQVVGKEGEDLSRHDKWLCMMYPRLMLLNKLLAKEGALVISIGYQEVNNLMVFLNEIFASRQIVCITVQTSGGKPAGGFNFIHEYLIFVVPQNFLPNPLLFTGGKERTPFEGLTLATFNKTQRPNQVYPIFIDTQNNRLAGVGASLQERVKKGIYQGRLDGFTYDYSEAPLGTVAIWPITSKGNECVWRLISSRLVNDWNKGYIKISPNKSTSSLNRYSIQYLPDGVIKKIESGALKVVGKENESPTLKFGENKTVGSEIPTIWAEKTFHTVKGTSLLNEIFDRKSFTYPKPLELISEILRGICSKNDVVLDSFAGSGTTAHGVLSLNNDGLNRKFILVEMEDYANSITAERVKRVIKGYADVEGTGGSFDYYELGQPLFDEYQNLNEAVGIEKIREYIWYSETRKSSTEGRKMASGNKYFLGEKEGTGYFFFYELNQGTTLDYDFIATIDIRLGQYVIYADNCLLPKTFMMQHNIVFKKIPRDISHL